MDPLFIFIVILMFLLAISDLIVGVSNDAVNFLNSAVGAKAGSFNNIMIIASIGIMFGAVFSSGMMEVARKGVFNPQYFTIEEIMFLFAAVMLTDIILLDFYNSIALPTSTTVSIVFELLGSAVAISFFSVINRGESIVEWGNYINGSRALVIILGIFLSIIIAFVLGWIVQYLARVIVTFNTNKSMRGFGSIFGAISVALIVVFIITKGLQGIPLISNNVLAGIKSNVGTISIITFGLSFIIFQILIFYFKFNVYRFITMLGTFALAMAFASNDLVNFIGVPIASFDSYFHWKHVAAGSADYMMDALAQPVQTNPLFLICAGIIMIITLWTSRKARSVVQTTVNLGRQYEGYERFEGNEFSRGIVKSITSVTSGINRLIPKKLVDKIDYRFTAVEGGQSEKDPDKGAFDLVRASVNLTVGAGIILVATSFKLPLSTTFVSFMVLMGTSLADRAWSKGSAVYRVSGVLIVIGGWFLTAIIALTVSMIFASLLINFKIYALVILVFFAAILILRNISFYRKRQKTEVIFDTVVNALESEFELIRMELLSKVADSLTYLNKSYSRAIEAFTKKKRKELTSIHSELADLLKVNNVNKIDITRQIPFVSKKYQSNAKAFMIIYDLEENALHTMEEIVKGCEKHVINLHQDLIKEQIETLKEIKNQIHQYISSIDKFLEKGADSDKGYSKLKRIKKSLIHNIEDGISFQISVSHEKKLSSKNSHLILSILFSSKSLVVQMGRFIKLLHLINLPDYSNRMLEEIIES